MSSHPPPALLALARATARAHAIPPALVCAVIEQESAWDTWAVRYEPQFYRRYIEPLLKTAPPLGDTEARARAFSWGLMQVMGQVAREHGYSANSLASLCDPANGIEIGCRVLAAKLAAARGDSTGALLSWNGGADRSYPAAVLARARNYADG
jgi:soluble lytic murein transglycosylase-like protein